MSRNNNTTDKSKVQSRVTYEMLEEFVRGKVGEFIQDILEQEVSEFLGRKKSERVGCGIDSRHVYRNGYGKPRRLALMSGTVKVRRPRLRNTDEFESRVLPLFKRQSGELGEALRELYLHGLSKGDFELALRGLLGEGAALSGHPFRGSRQSGRRSTRNGKTGICHNSGLCISGQTVCM